MKQFFASRKSMAAAAILSTFLVGGFAASEIVSNKVSATRNLNAGSNTCFTRVGQTFTALMIKDFASRYASPDFMGMTGECFAQVNKSFEALFGGAFLEAKKPLNKLTADLFWFHEKTQKLFDLSKTANIELTTSSNILSKYSSLEEMNGQFQEKLDQKISSLSVWRNVFAGIALAASFGVVAFAFMVGSRRQKEKSALLRHDEEARAILEGRLDPDMLNVKTNRLLENLFKLVEAPHCYELFNKAQSDLLEKNASALSDDHPVQAFKPQTETLEEPGEKTNFTETANGLLDRMGQKIFTHGIILDESLGDEFWIRGNAESLEQLLHNLLSFAVENSLHHNEGRKVAVRSKALGGIAYFKTKISNYLLNPEELELFNERGATKGGNVNLLLMKEIAVDMGASIAAKNILNQGAFTGCEIELVFKRANSGAENAAPKEEPQLKSLVKGTKKELLKAFRSEA